MLADRREGRNPRPLGRASKDGFGLSFFADLWPMMKSGIGISTRLDISAALDEAVGSAVAGLGGSPVDAALVMATAAWGRAALSDLVDRVDERLGHAAWAGASVEGLLVGNREITNRPGLAVATLSGLRAEAFLCDGLVGHEAAAGAEIASALPHPARSQDLLVLFADSVNLEMQPLLAGLVPELGELAVVGIGASELAGDSPRVWARGRCSEGGCAGLWLRPTQSPRVAVTRGVRRLTESLEVTRTQGHWVLGLGGRPALDVLSESLTGPSDNLGAENFLVAIQRLEESTGKAGDSAVIRNLIGSDPGRGAVGVAEPMVAGDRLWLVRPDREVAREELLERISVGGSERAALGLYLSCPSRGEMLFERAGLEGELLAGALGGGPFLGMSGAFQLAPDPGAAGTTLLHRHSGVLARFDP